MNQCIIYDLQKIIRRPFLELRTEMVAAERFSYEAVLYLAAEARMDQVDITVKSSRATDSPSHR